MSVVALSWAMRQTQLRAALRLTLVYMADITASDTGEGMYLPLSKIARRMGVSRSTVQEHVRELLDLGLIRLGDQQLTAHYPEHLRATVYDLVLDDKPASKPGRKTHSGVGPSTLPSARACPGAGRDPALEPGGTLPPSRASKTQEETQEETSGLRGVTISPARPEPVDNHPPTKPRPASAAGRSFGAGRMAPQPRCPHCRVVTEWADRQAMIPAMCESCQRGPGHGPPPGWRASIDAALAAQRAQQMALDVGAP